MGGVQRSRVLAVPAQTLAALLLLALLLPGVTGGCGRRGGSDEAPKQAALPPPPLSPRTIPILCMHDLGENVRNSYSINTADLRKYLQWLKDEEYQTVTVRDVVAYLNRERELAKEKKPIVLSFDDAWKSARTIAMPTLKEYGYVGVAFVPTSSVGANDSKLSWDDLSALADAGWEIGSHSTTHENLTKVKPGQAPESIRDMVDDQIRASKTAIEENTEAEVVSFAYPFGNYDTYVMQTVADAGYQAGLSIDRGPADEQSDPLCLPRTMIMRDTSFRTFQRICQQRSLHIADLSPPRGSRVTEVPVQVTGTLTDSDVIDAPTGELQTERLKVAMDPASRSFSFTADLNHGANSVVLRSAGRVTSWLLIRDS